MNILFLKIKQNPKFYYSMMIAATWAGAGSLIVGLSMAQTFGIIPFAIWALGNTLACIVFGLLAHRIPKLMEVAMSKPVKLVVGVMAVFQIWVNMQGLYEALALTPMGVSWQKFIVYGASLGIVIFYLTRPMLKNVSVGYMAWVVTYVMIIGLMIYAFVTNGVTSPSLGLEPAGILNASNKFLLLLPGCFLYPVFWEMWAYNEKNEDGTAKVDLQACFVAGGLLFGLYLLFVLALAFTKFTPTQNAIKGILIFSVAVDSLASFLFSVLITFGKKFGAGINVAAIIGWSFLIPLGVLGLWTKMAEFRIVVIALMVLTSFVWYFLEKRKNAENQKI